MDYFVWKQLLKNLVLPPTGPVLLAGLGLVLVARRKTRLSGVIVCALGLVVLWVLATPIAADSLVRWAERYPALDPGQAVVSSGPYRFVRHPMYVAAIVMALALAARIAGDEVAQRIQLGIEYDPQPPFNAGSPETAPPHIVAEFRAASRFSR